MLWLCFLYKSSASYRTIFCTPKIQHVSRFQEYLLLSAFSNFCSFRRYPSGYDGVLPPIREFSHPLKGSLYYTWSRKVSVVYDNFAIFVVHGSLVLTGVSPLEDFSHLHFTLASAGWWGEGGGKDIGRLAVSRAWAGSHPWSWSAFTGIMKSTLWYVMVLYG